MFHGCLFQGLRAIGALVADGIDGTIESLPTPGAFLDNARPALRLVGHGHRRRRFRRCPSRLSASSGSGRGPPDGERASTTVRIADLDHRTVRADLELVWAGSVVTRIAGWVDRRFDSDPQLWRACCVTPSAAAMPMAAGYRC